jgi:thioredoxin 1
MIKEVNDGNFAEEVLLAEGTVLVKAGANWCASCKYQMPVLEKLAEEMPQIKILELDIDDSPDATKYYGIRGVPTLLVFRDGHEITSKVGLTKLDELKEMVK